MRIAFVFGSIPTRNDKETDLQRAVVEKKDWLGQEAEAVAAELARRQPSSAVSVHLMYTSDAVLSNAGVEWFATRPPGFMTHRFFYMGKQWSFRWIHRILDWKPDLIHWQMNSYPWVFHLASRYFVRRHIPYVYQHHGPRLARKGYIRAVLRYPNRMADRGIYLTRDHEVEYRDGLGLDSARNIVIPVGYNENFRPMNRDECRRKTGIRGNPALFWAAGITVRKDPITVLKAFDAVAAGFPDAHFTLAGYGPLDAEVAALVRSSPRLSKQVTLLGYVNNADLPAMENAADIFVMGSRGEGFCVASMEAMACGLFPVLTTLACFKEQTDNGRLGLLYEPGDVDGCAQQLRKAMGDVAYREAVRRQLPATMANLTWGHSARHLVDLYEQVLAQRAASADPASTGIPRRHAS